MSLQVPIDHIRLGDVCRKWQIAELSVFGSVLRDDFGPDSDVDILVTFEPGTRIGFIGLGQLAEELAQLFGRRVDLVPKAGLKPVIKDEVLASARPLYAA